MIEEVLVVVRVVPVDPLATGFVLLLHIFHIIPQVGQSFNVMETVLKSATNGLLPGMDYLPGTGPGAHDRASA